jgi:hypothetical protein
MWNRGSLGARLLMAINPNAILIVVWVAIAVTASISFLQAPWRTQAVFVVEAFLGLIWFGYPILVCWFFGGRVSKLVGAPMLAIGVISAAWLAAHKVKYADAPWLSILLLIFVAAPFLAGALALRRAERQAFEGRRTNILVGCLSLLALPLLGGYFHTKVRRVIATRST